jgi:hypothetical protein
MASASAHLDQRRQTYDVVATRLAAMSHEQIAHAVAAEATTWRASVHGSQSGTIEVEDVKVFVKKISLTDLERAAENGQPTANLFDLPGFYHYGVGSAGFGVWRELKACLKASAWAYSGECPHFPFVYHWRVLPRTARPPLAFELQAWLDRAPVYWDNSDAVRARLAAISAASVSVVLFLEYVPDTMRGWLKLGLSEASPDAELEAAILRVHDQLRDTAAFMNERGMLHFDLNASNLLTDGEQVYAADFGLAICEDFDLSPAERTFFETHRFYDSWYVAWVFVEWLALRANVATLTPALRALVDRYTPVADIMRRFFEALREQSKTTPFPAAELEAALAGQPASR